MQHVSDLAALQCIAVLLGGLWIAGTGRLFCCCSCFVNVISDEASARDAASLLQLSTCLFIGATTTRLSEAQSPQRLGNSTHAGKLQDLPMAYDSTVDLPLERLSRLRPRSGRYLTLLCSERHG